MLTKLLRWIYTILFVLLLPWVVGRLLWRSLSYRAYRSRIAERFGFYYDHYRDHDHYSPNQNINSAASPSNGLVTSPITWVHAVSVGETIAAIPLIKAMLLNEQNEKASNQALFVFTCTTPTGSECFQKALETELLSFKQQIEHVYMPYDIPCCLNRFIQKYHPTRLVLLETELWPNCLSACDTHNIPVIIANARLSPRSFKRYEQFKTILKPFLKPIKGVLTQSDLDSQRFKDLGFSPKIVQNLGNIKFDGATPNIDKSLLSQVELAWSGKTIWLAASTHEGEEELILNVFAELVTKYPHLVLILVPRHPDRFDKVANLIEHTGLSYQRRQKSIPNANTQVWLGDSLGEMWTYIAASSIVFVGGSLIPIGGHNLLEPAALSKPILTGPHLHNFLAIKSLLILENALLIVSSHKELYMAVEKLVLDAQYRNTLGQNAEKALLKNKGAIQKHLDFIQGLGN